MTEENRSQFMEALLEISELVMPVSDFVIGYRRNLVEGGFDPPVATAMAYEVHHQIIRMILTGGAQNG